MERLALNPEDAYSGRIYTSHGHTAFNRVNGDTSQRELPSSLVQIHPFLCLTFQHYLWSALGIFKIQIHLIQQTPVTYLCSSWSLMLKLVLLCSLCHYNTQEIIWRIQIINYLPSHIGKKKKIQWYMIIFFEVSFQMKCFIWKKTSEYLKYLIHIKYFNFILCI